MSYHLVSPGLLVPVSLSVSFAKSLSLSACQWRQSDHSSHQAINAAWLKFSILLLISKVMRQRCVIIENLTRCPPISHPGRPGRGSPLQLNVPRKPDKTVINAKSLCLLSCSEKGQCHCPLACSQRVQKGKDKDKDRTKFCCCSGFNHQPQFPCSFGACVWKQVVYTYCKSSPLSVLCVTLFPCFQRLYNELQLFK